MEEETLIHFLKRQKTSERKKFDFWNQGGLKKINLYLPHEKILSTNLIPTVYLVYEEPLINFRLTPSLKLLHFRDIEF